MNKISKLGLSRLDPAVYAVTDASDRPDAVIVRSADMHGYAMPESLLAIARAGAGTNNIPIPECTKQGVAVFNTPGANANAVKELTLCALTLASRMVFESIVWAQSLKGKGDEVPPLVEKGKANFAGPELTGKKLGIIGLGKIGGMVANGALAMGMEVCGVDPFLSPQAAAALDAKVVRLDDIKQLYAECDYISLHAFYTKENKHMLNTETIAQMKPGVRILNFSRGELVDDTALIAALGSGHVAKYVTDFPNEALLGHPGVIAIPHLASSTPESEENCAVMAADEIKAYLETGAVINSVNLPNSAPEWKTTYRVCVIHDECDGILGSIKAALPNSAIISNAMKGIAYTIADADVPPVNLSETLPAGNGVIRVRVLQK
jgi:D-3-phosphoglycerate dehydrogenase